MTTDEYDVIVIGGGPVGENAADYATRDSDRTAAIVEADLLGGECSYWACMPSKALLRPVEVAATANNLSGIKHPVRLDAEGLLKARDGWVSHYDDAGQVQWAEEAGLAVVRGRGRLEGERQVVVTAADGKERRLRARQAVVVATGSTPVVPPMYEPIRPWGSRDATAVTEIPRRLVIVGGGVVACEAAGWMAALGSEVTMLVRGDALLGRAEPFAGEAVAEALREAGVTIRFGAEVDQVTRPDTHDPVQVGRLHGGEVKVTIRGSEASYDELMLATGRKPATGGLGIPDELPEWLHVVGDASGEPPLTHWGKYRARQVGDLIAARAEGREPMGTPESVPVPQVVFTDPQVAWVGQTEAEARKAGIDVDVRSAEYTSAAGAALLRDDASGRAQLVVDKRSGTLVGATFVGPEVAELLHSATIAIVGQVPLATLRHAVPSYPTASEIWLRLLEG